MKIGDLVTYKQREDLQQFPCPWHRMGIVLGIAPGSTTSVEFEVYWYSAGNIVSWAEEDLEIAQ